MRYRPDIDGLRAVAIIPVVLFHFRVAPFAGGFVGVDVFFVISGFLITSIIFPEVLAGKFSIAVFYERRVRRLFPALFTVLIVSTIAAVFLLLPRDLASFSKSLASAALFGANVYYFRTAGYFDTPSELKPLLHTWSLAVEEQFYIVYPAMLVLTYRFFKGRARAVVTVLAVVSFAASFYAVRRYPSAAFYLPFFRAWELFLGAFLALGPLPAVSMLVRNVVAGAGLVAIVYSVFAYSEATLFPGAAALIPCLGTAALIYAGAHGPIAVTRLLSHRPIVLVGLASYSLYLWHWPVLVFVKYYLARDLAIQEKLLLILVSGVLAMVSLRYVESPFRVRRTRPPLFARPALFAVSAACTAMLVLVGVGGRSGLPRRFAPAIVEAAATATEPRPYVECEEVPGSCTIGAPGAPPTFLLWGDSHALALAPAIDRVARREGRAGLLAGRAACPPILGIERTGRANECRPFNASVIEMLQRNAGIRTVILAGRWALSTRGSRYGQEGGEPVILSPRGIEDNPRVFAEGLERTVQFLDRNGYEVVFVTQVPEVGWPVPSVLARNLLHGRQAPPGPSLEEYRERQKQVAESLDRLRPRFPVRVVDITPIFCPGHSCVAVDAGGPLYRDEHHLSRHGAVFVADRLARLFE